MLNHIYMRFVIATVFACTGPLQATSLDPLGLAEQLPSSSWKQVMKEFRRLDTNEDG
jgi:hypothetical protein